MASATGPASAWACDPAVGPQVEAAPHQGIDDRHDHHEPGDDLVEARHQQDARQERRPGQRPVGPQAQVGREIQHDQRGRDDLGFLDAGEVPDAERAAVDRAKRHREALRHGRRERPQRRPYADGADQGEHGLQEMQRRDEPRERLDQLHPARGQENGGGMEPEDAVEVVVVRQPPEDVALGQLRVEPRVGGEMCRAAARLEQERGEPVEVERHDRDQDELELQAATRACARSWPSDTPPAAATAKVFVMLPSPQADAGRKDAEVRKQRRSATRSGILAQRHECRPPRPFIRGSRGPADRARAGVVQ